jgi:hypothetical protein
LFYLSISDILVGKENHNRGVMMVGRNEPCPCGSGKKYKKCCERVVTLSAAERAREERDGRLKNELLRDLFRWFSERFSYELKCEWEQRFKKLLGFPADQPVSSDFSMIFQFWLLFDAPCLNRKRPVELWMSTVRNSPAKERLARSFSESRFVSYEIKEKREGAEIYRRLSDGAEFEVIHGPAIPLEDIIFARLFRVGNRYELLGPYSAFPHEMRGEILVQLEKYERRQEERHDFAPWDNEFRVLGWTIQRAGELEKIEKRNLVSSPPDLPESVKAMPLWPVVEPKEEELPVRIMQQLEQFYVNHVASLQKGTQKFYSRSLELLYKYLSARYGQQFEWSLLDEDALVHFLSVWYLDNAKTSTRASRIFLNTLKYLFRWLEQEGISDVYQRFKKVYVHLIRALPTAVEAGKWMRENGVASGMAGSEEESSAMYMLAMSSTGPVLRVEDKWMPAHLAGFPWADQRFWVRGLITMDAQGCLFTRVDGVYPMVLLDKQLKVLGHK